MRIGPFCSLWNQIACAGDRGARRTRSLTPLRRSAPLEVIPFSFHGRPNCIGVSQQMKVLARGRHTSRLRDEGSLPRGSGPARQPAMRWRGDRIGSLPLIGKALEVLLGIQRARQTRRKLICVVPIGRHWEYPQLVLSILAVLSLLTRVFTEKGSRI